VRNRLFCNPFVLAGSFVLCAVARKSNA
jgi:hypothetical protein